MPKCPAFTMESVYSLKHISYEVVLEFLLILFLKKKISAKLHPVFIDNPSSLF